MKITFIQLFIACSFAFGYAQQGQVNVEQDAKINDLLKIYKTSNQKVSYYRIQVGFGSHNEASQIKSKVEVDFPDLSSEIDFDSPNFKVRVGRFKNKLDAIRKFEEVRKKYPEAMLLRPKKST